MKEKSQEKDKEKTYWREKCRAAEKKGEEINLKIVDLENELRNIIFDKHQQAEYRIQ